MGFWNDIQDVITPEVIAGGVGTVVGGPVVGAAAVTAVSLFGPDYDPGNGGEVDRQLKSMSEWASDAPLMDAYKYYLQTYHPSLWQNGQIWNVNRTVNDGHPSAFRDRYLQIVASGWERGTFTVEPNGQPKAATAKSEGEGGTKQGTGESGFKAGKFGGFVLGGVLLVIILVVTLTRRNGSRKAARKGNARKW